ncbi:MAG: flagellar hook capping FlgD N-terminal domain-containing protein [Terriglobia bacterium]
MISIQPASAGSPTSSAATNSQNTAGSQNSTSGLQPQEITTQDFMTLLSTQLKYQAPTNPVDPTTFVTQLAQFVTLDQVTQINNTLQGYVQDATGRSSSGNTGSNSPGASGVAQTADGSS